MKKIFSQFRTFHGGIADIFRHNCQANVQNISSKMGAVGVRQRLQATGRAPAAPILKTCLCAAILPFPVVKAWSVWHKKEGSDDEAIEGFAKTLRFKNISTTERKALAKLLYEVDDLYKHGDPSEYNSIFKTLFEQADKKEPEIQWRLARITYALAKKADNAEKKAKMLEGAFELVTTALEMDEGNFAVHKWVAILLNEVSILKGLKEQIIQSVNVKIHIMRAVELNPIDATCHYMLGNWCFSVADVPWYQKKVAATLFATPPESTYKEALEHFLTAENLEPGFYSMNHLMLAKTYINLGEPQKAARYLKFLESRIVRTDDDYSAKMEAVELAKKYFKSQKHLDEAAAQIEDVIVS